MKRNKRRGPDLVVKAVNTIVGVSWVIIVGVMIAFSIAKPRFEGFQRDMQAVGGNWDEQGLDIMLYLFLFQILICGLGLTFNALRLRRATDQLSRSLIVFAIISIFGLIGVTIAM